MEGTADKKLDHQVRFGVRMTYSRAVVERAGAAGGAVGRAVAKMDLPKVVGDGPVYPDIDPDDKDALI